MGWKGAIRSINAAAKAAERESQRQFKAAEKERITSEVADAVDDWKQYIKDLTSVHVKQANAVNWEAIANSPKPEEPGSFMLHRQKVAPRMKNFKPGFFDFFYGGTEKLRLKLIAEFKAARSRDEADKQRALEEHRISIEDWEKDVAIANQLLSGAPDAAHQVISEMLSISDKSMVGESVRFKFDQGVIHAIPQVHTDEVIPSFRRKQLASGKLSETKMPASEFNELYQDYVASVALKIAGDLFQILPNEEVYVTCTTSMLNTKTGYQLQTPIISVRFIRETFMRLNLDRVDPSDSLDNFIHEMDFKRTKGFSQITPIYPIEQISTVRTRT